MSYDPNEFEFDTYEDDPFDEDSPEFNEENAESKRFFGMSMAEIAILVGLLIAIVVLGGFVALNFINNVRSPSSVQKTAISPTPVPSTTPFVKSTPIPDWNKFEFSDTPAEIWLPQSFQGGDPLAYPEIVAMTIDFLLPNETHADYAKVIANDPATLFFAFDSDPNAPWRSAQVNKDPFEKTAFDMEVYLHQIVEDVSDRDIRVTNQYLTDLVYYSDVGVLVFEAHQEIVEGEIYLFKFYLFAIPIEDEIWQIWYQISRDDAAYFQDTIFKSAHSFYVQP